MNPLPLSSSLGRRDGVVLVIVLAFLVLLSVLIISFYSSVGTELVASKQYSSVVSTRQLSETATNFVMGQITDATSGFEKPGDNASPILAWASQPGMIRTYKETGLPFRFYKLYSAANMIITDHPADFNVNTEFAADTPVDWWQNPAIFTDLNAPIKVGEGQFDYPIVDPTGQKTFATSNDGIDGFEIMEGPGFTGSGTRPTANDNPTSSPAANPAMMPTRWIYVLRDGTLTAAPDAASAGGKLSWANVTDPLSKPTKANPIVGRIAFWSDDDTSKVNINTASEGTFWDRPWARNSSEDEIYARHIPGQGEVQRYAGHPATTCLSPILGFVIPPSLNKKNYYSLIPRVNDGGTNAGTTMVQPLIRDKNGNYVKSVVPDNDRLFASVDEMAFGPVFKGIRTGFTSKGSPGIPEDRAREVLNKAKFFLTAGSRAPDVNIFNKPRICVWPMQLDDKETSKERNANDRYIAFCSTTGSNATGTGIESKYYFQRYSIYAETDGLNGVDTFPHPKPGEKDKSPSATHPTLDWGLPKPAGSIKGFPDTEVEMLRNRQLYSYLRELTKKNVPGFGASLEKKYDAGLPTGYSDRDQILTQIVDYIRTQVNTYNTAGNLKPQYDYAPTRRGGSVAGETQLVPLRIGSAGANYTPATTMGFGRFATVTEVGIAFRRNRVGANSFLRAHIILEPFNPTPGVPTWCPNVRYIIKGLENFKVGGPAFMNASVDLGFPKPNGNLYPFNWVTARSSGNKHTGGKAALMGMQTSFCFFSRTAGYEPGKKYGISGARDEYPFNTKDGARIGNTAGNFSIAEDVPLEIEIYSGYQQHIAGMKPRPDLLVQTLRLTLPKTGNTLPMPVEDSEDFNARISDASRADRLMKPSDVIRSVGIDSAFPAGGDLRLISALADVPKEAFVPNPKYQGTEKHAHNLRSTGTDLRDSGADLTRLPILVPSAPIHNDIDSRPVAADGLLAAEQIASKSRLQGDFDTGVAGYPDGCYINKADEGNNSTSANASDGGAASYWDFGYFNIEDGQTFSPNRSIASAVSFGSMPTGVKSTEAALRHKRPSLARPWQTLLFTANPSSRTIAPPDFSLPVTKKHPGFGVALNGRKNQPPYSVVPDHLWLDFFTMPVIEPYAISEPLSTAGRVNLNYQIAPFTYIKRTTGLHAVLKSVQIAAIPTRSMTKAEIMRYPINPTVGDSKMDGAKLDGAVKGTLYGFQEKFNGGDIFRSASQICDISLVPEKKTRPVIHYDKIDKDFWDDNKMTGDNVREIPYGHIYPRVTTKSNTYTVHMRVQALHKTPTSAVDEWDERTDKVAGEYRGSTTIERYIDASDIAIPDFALDNVTDNLDRHYRFRIIGTKAFVR